MSFGFNEQENSGTGIEEKNIFAVKSFLCSTLTKGRKAAQKRYHNDDDEEKEVWRDFEC